MKTAIIIAGVACLLAFDAIRAIASGFSRGVYRVACTVAQWGALA
jgi:hypothetical protein